MAKLTGKDLAFTLAGVAISVPRGWSYEETDVDVDSTAAGDAWMDRDSLRGDFTVEVNALVQIATPYVLPTAIRGTKVAFTGKTVSSHTNNIISGTAKVGRFRIEGAYDGLFQIAVTLNAAGTAPTITLTGT
jgi:hypothetical protein